MVDTTMSMSEMLELLQIEAESLDGIYFEENVVAEQPQATQVPKHELLSRIADEKHVM